MSTVENVVVHCSCGMIPLAEAQHANSRSAWEYLAKHVARNHKLCKPTMTRMIVPTRLGVTR